MSITTQQPAWCQFVAFWTYQGDPWSATLRHNPDKDEIQEFVQYDTNEDGDDIEVEKWVPWSRPVGVEITYYTP